jgi:hypothetical protein
MEVLSKLEQLDPAFVDADALVTLRADLYDLKTPIMGLAKTSDNAIAAKAYNAVTSVITNPTNQAGDFVTAWTRANDIASQRFDTLDKALISNIMRADQGLSMQTLSALSDSLIASNKSEQIDFLRSLGPRGEEAVKALQDTFETQILDNVLDPQAMARVMASVRDRPTLEALIPDPTRRRDFTQLMQNMEELQSSALVAARKAKDEAQPLINQILSTTKDTDIKFLSGLINDAGGLDSELGRSIRHGIKDHIAEVAMAAGGTKEIQSAALNTELKRLAELGIMQLLPASDRAMLRELPKVIDFFAATRATADFGASLRSMEVTSALYSFDAAKTTGAIRDLVKAYGISRFMLSDIGRGMLVGRAGVQYTQLDPLRLATMVTGSILADQEQQQ